MVDYPEASQKPPETQSGKKIQRGSAAGFRFPDNPSSTVDMVCYLLYLMPLIKKINCNSWVYIMQIMQFDWFLSVLEQKLLENHEIYTLGAAE